MYLLCLLQLAFCKPSKHVAGHMAKLPLTEHRAGTVSGLWGTQNGAGAVFGREWREVGQSVRGGGGP